MNYNIFFNGSSICRGRELDDIEKFRYSSIIAQKLNLKVSNIALDGLSNDAIVRTTIEWFENKNTCDLAIIQFTYSERSEYFFDGNINQLSAWMINSNIKKPHVKIGKYYYLNYYNDCIGVENLYKNKFLLETYFSSINQKYLIIEIIPPTKIKIEYWKKFCSNNHTFISDIIGNNDDLRFRKYWIKDGKKSEHPNNLGHEKIAEYIIDNIVV